MRRMLTARIASAVVGAVTVLTLVSGTAQAQANPNPGVFPVGSLPFGASYAEWSARWWQWAFSTPNTAGGPFDAGAINCGVHQPAHVWFLSGPFNTTGAVDRSCTMPAGTALFIPVLNVECSDQEPAPFFGATPEKRKACVELFRIADLSVTVDGQSLRKLDSYVVTSPDFPFNAVPDNPTGVTSSGRSTSRGAFLMLSPLSAGEHDITFMGSFPDFPFTASATYHIVVK
jgi:hypothetical protein